MSFSLTLFPAEQQRQMTQLFSAEQGPVTQFPSTARFDSDVVKEGNAGQTPSKYMINLFIFFVAEEEFAKHVLITSQSQRYHISFI